MENNIVDELLNKIKSIETANSDLKSKIKEIKSKLNSSSVINESNQSNVNLEDGKLNFIYFLEMLVDYQSNTNLNFNSNSILENKLNIINNVVEHNISYIPNEQFNSLWIMADFTNWEPKQMNKNKDVFNFNVLLIKGFKYYFTFTARSEENIIDFNQDHEINPRNGQIANFIDIKISDDILSDPFNYLDNNNLLNEAKINFTKVNMHDQNEVSLLEEIIDFTKKYVKRNQYLSSKKDEISEKICKYYG
jgi:hypothetical protein